MNYALFLVLFCGFVSGTATETLPIKTLYGETEIIEPVLIDLIQCPTMQRLKEIQQYGISYYIAPLPSYTRFDHSVGVFYLVRRFGGTLLEQIAALLHDVSHTVFSHVGDHLFRHDDRESSYQDETHLDFIRGTEIVAILQQYGIALADIDHKKNHYPMLEQDIPNLCADRLEYVLYGGYIENILSRDDINEIMMALMFGDEKWIFTSLHAARKYADTALYLNEHRFGSVWNFVVYEWAAELLRRALEIGLIGLHDVRYSTDRAVWSRLNQSDDSIIKILIGRLYNAVQHYCIVDSEQQYDVCVLQKFRGVDPWVKTETGINRLHTLDDIFACHYNALQAAFKRGYHIRYRGL